VSLWVANMRSRDGKLVRTAVASCSRRPTVGLMVHNESGRHSGADARAESAMESEARLVMIEHGLPLPELQYEIRGRDGEIWRVDFAWPEARVAAEYESVEWHAARGEMPRDKSRFAKVQELGWTMSPIVVDDVRREPWRLAERIDRPLTASRAAR
jgi:very-short-patch-repair endonuclease